MAEFVFAIVLLFSLINILYLAHASMFGSLIMPFAFFKFLPKTFYTLNSLQQFPLKQFPAVPFQEKDSLLSYTHKPKRLVLKARCAARLRAPLRYFRATRAFQVLTCPNA